MLPDQLGQLALMVLSALLDPLGQPAPEGLPGLPGLRALTGLPGQLELQGRPDLPVLAALPGLLDLLGRPDLLVLTGRQALPGPPDLLAPLARTVLRV